MRHHKFLEIKPLKLLRELQAFYLLFVFGKGKNRIHIIELFFFV